MSRIFLNSGTLIVIVGFQFFFIRIKGYIVTHPFPEQGSSSSLSGSRVPISPYPNRWIPISHYPDQGFQFLLIWIKGSHFSLSRSRVPISPYSDQGFQFLIIRIQGSNFSLFGSRVPMSHYPDPGFQFLLSRIKGSNFFFSGSRVPISP